MLPLRKTVKKKNKYFGTTGDAISKYDKIIIVAGFNAEIEK